MEWFWQLKWVSRQLYILEKLKGEENLARLIEVHRALLVGHVDGKHGFQ